MGIQLGQVILISYAGYLCEWYGTEKSVATYGEVLESKGKPGEKNRIMQQYKTEYFRRRAFHDELRRFGMRS